MAESKFDDRDLSNKRISKKFDAAIGKKQGNSNLFGYRYKQAEFKDGELTTEFTFSGPIAGFAFGF